MRIFSIFKSFIIGFPNEKSTVKIWDLHFANYFLKPEVFYLGLTLRAVNFIRKRQSSFRDFDRPLFNIKTAHFPDQVRAFR